GPALRGARNPKATPAGSHRPIPPRAPAPPRLIGGVSLSETASAAPLSPPGLTPPRQPHHIVLDLNRWSWDGQSFAGLLDAPRLAAKMSALPYDVGVEISDRPEGADSNIGRICQCSLTAGLALLADSCYGNRTAGYAGADLQNYFTDHLFQYLNGAPDYEVPVFQFNVPDALAQPGWIGIAISNDADRGWTSVAFPDRRQSFVFTSMT